MHVHVAGLHDMYTLRVYTCMYTYLNYVQDWFIYILLDIHVYTTLTDFCFLWKRKKYTGGMGGSEERVEGRGMGSVRKLGCLFDVWTDQW